MSTSRALGVALLILAGAPIGVPAQANIRASAVRARAGQNVRIDVTQIGRFEGRLLGADEGMLTLDRNGGPARFQLADLERLWVRGSRSTGRGARIGALVAGGIGIAFGFWLAGEVSHCDAYEPEPCIPKGVGAALGGVVFAAGGAVLGAGIGFAIRPWRLVFP